MKIHCLQHVSFEGPAAIADWANLNGHTISYTRFYQNDTLPVELNFDLLVIMGGPMSFDDDAIYDWMPKEKAFIKKAVDAGVAAIGICLGAQFLALALGAKAHHGQEQEIGWFPVNFVDQTKFPFLPPTTPVFHWHGDTFDIPSGALRIASTKAFPNQGFVWNKKVVGLQFHLEVTPESVVGMIENVGHEIGDGEFCQSPEEILANEAHYTPNIHILYQILDQIIKA